MGTRLVWFHVARPLTVLALMCVQAGATEWVEIPLHVKSPGAGGSTTTTIRPSGLVHSQFLAHLSTHPKDAGHAWTTASTVRRWRPDHRQISDLLDYDPHSDGAEYWSEAERGPGSVDHAPGDSRYYPVATVNVSSKVEEVWQSDGEPQDESMETQLLPFGNRYEEESIEESAASAEGDKVDHRVELVDHHPSPVQFDDFDDYDERMSVQQQPEQQQMSSQHQELPGNEELEESEEYDEPVLAHHKRKPSIKAPSVGFGGFVEFLRRMQANFVLRTAHTIGDKIRTLTDLRDQLLSSIERRIAALWRAPESANRRSRRVKRGWMDPHAGADAMDFPSAEGALLTISFLTFAVFLIKLVLQVINTIKAKHYTYSTFAASTPVSGGVLVKRVRRRTAPWPSDPSLANTVDRLSPTILSAINNQKFT